MPTWRTILEAYDEKEEDKLSNFFPPPTQLNSTLLYSPDFGKAQTHTLTHPHTHTHTHKNGNRVTEICYVDISFFFHPTLFHAQKNIEVLVLTHLLLLLSFQEIQKLDFKKYPEQKEVKKILGFSSACSCLITYICSTEAPFILIIGFHIQIFILTSIRPKCDMLENLWTAELC